MIQHCASPRGLMPLQTAMRQKLMLGLFLRIQSGAWSPPTAPRDTSWTFDDNARCTLRAEALGFDLVFSRNGWAKAAMAGRYLPRGTRA